MRIEKTLVLDEKECIAIDTTFNVVDKISAYLNDNGALVADRIWYPKDIERIQFFLNELTSCVLTIEEGEEK